MSEMPQVDLPDVVDEDETISEEELKVRNWRLRELDRMGVSLEPAIKAAKTRALDIRYVYQLIEQGCQPDTAVRIATPIEA